MLEKTDSLNTVKGVEVHQDQIVKFDNGNFSGEGKIVGIANTGHPVIGKNIMVQTNDFLPDSNYPFNTIVVFEVHIKEIEINGEFTKV